MPRILLSFLSLAIIVASCSQDENLDYRSESFAENHSGNVDNQNAGNEYNTIVENKFIKTSDEKTSTFSIDADGGAYANVRKYLNEGQMPPRDAVRIEELINYFDYQYAEPSGSDPINIDLEMADCPWKANNKLIKIGMKGKSIPEDEIPASNFVFLIDASGSMSSPYKLGLVQYGFKQMVDELDADDRVSIVTYASNAGVLLQPTAGDEKAKIKAAIESITSGGSTNGEGGIKQAYALAESAFIQGGNNRVILATDGDFNVGLSDQDKLIELIEEKRKTGVFLTVIGVGHGNLQDGTMEQLANNGNGTYEYIDSENQASRVLKYKLGRMYTVAKDVKVQVEFNPAVVKSYRLIGYSNRVLENEDFEDDNKDAGELGAGQTITAFYEVVPVNQAAKNSRSLTFKFRYKAPDEESSQELSEDLKFTGGDFASATEDFRFSASVASWGMLLMDSGYSGEATLNDVLNWSKAAKSYDPQNDRQEFVELVEKSKELMN